MDPVLQGVPHSNLYHSPNVKLASEQAYLFGSEDSTQDESYSEYLGWKEHIHLTKGFSEENTTIQIDTLIKNHSSLFLSMIPTTSNHLND